MHRKAKLTVVGRRVLVERIELERWPIAHAAETTGVSRQAATKWVRRYRAEGLAGLEDRSSRPRRSPRPTCAAFLREAAAWFARQGVRIERVMTDNPLNYTPLARLPGRAHRSRGAPQADPLPAAPDQWQERALQDVARRVGLRSALRVEH